MDQNEYRSPLSERYASKEMCRIWSAQSRYSTWRRLWLVLARAQRNLGLPITDEQVARLEAHLDDIDFARVQEKEKRLRHDVMSHLHVFAEQCPEAKPILHLGATSCYVTDNTDLILMRSSLALTRGKLLRLLDVLRALALRHKNLPTLGYTHYQPAQLTTVGKRVTLWLQDFLMDFVAVERQWAELPFRGVKGATGTQASFLDLFNGDHDKVRALDRQVAAEMGFSKTVSVCGQTYSRKIDSQVLSVIAGIGQSACKMAGDIRHLMNLKEADEPFEASQIGSSAMAYKRNPMRSERICSLARYVMSLTDGAAQTAANQWFERTLDDSAIRRIILPESFLAVDAILRLCTNVTNGIVFWPLVIRRRMDEELPFMATEAILMSCVKAGGDRQELHEAIRVHALAAARRVKEEGAANDLLERIAADQRFKAIHGQMPNLLDPGKFIGRAPEQVDEFIAADVDPILRQYGDLMSAAEADIEV